MAGKGFTHNLVILSGTVKPGSIKYTEKVPGKGLWRAFVLAQDPFDGTTFNMPVVGFGQFATKVLKPLVRNGGFISVEGHLKTRSWQDPAGKTQYITEVIVDKLTLPGPGAVLADEDTETPDLAGWPD